MPNIVTTEPSAEEGADRPLARLFPFRFLGVGLLFAWDWCLHGQTTMTLTGALTEGPNFITASVLAETFVLLILAVLARRIGSIARHPALLGVGCLAGISGTVLVACAQNDLLPGTASFIGGFLAGCAGAVLLLGWAEVYARLSPGQVFLFGSLSLAFACAVYGVAARLVAPFGFVASALVPTASFGLCLLSMARVGPEPLPRNREVRYTLPWKPVIIMGTCGFTAAFVDVSLFAQGTLPHILADLVAGCVLAGVVAMLHAPVKPVALVGASIALVVAGILAVALFGAAAAFTSSLLVMLSYVVMTFFTYALLANICHRREVPTLWLFGFAAAARTVMDHLGGFARLCFPELGRLADSPLDLAVMAAVGLVAIGAILLVWLSERSFNSSWAVQVIDVRDGHPVVNPHEQLLARCEATAAERGLTAREAEILSLLVEGKTYQQMSSELLLSANTVKTHARHMYAKLGVHTREEALALVNSDANDMQSV